MNSSVSVMLLLMFIVSIPLVGKHFGEGNNKPVWPQYVLCTGNESSLQKCDFEFILDDPPDPCFEQSFPGVRCSGK